MSLIITSCVQKEKSLQIKQVKELNFQDITYSNTPQKLSEFIESISYH